SIRRNSSWAFTSSSTGVKAGVVAALSKLISGALLPLPKVTSALRPTILLRIPFATLEPEPERPEGVAGADPARPVSINVLTPPAPKKNDLLARLAVMTVSFGLFQSDARSGTIICQPRAKLRGTWRDQIALVKASAADL